MLYREAGQFKTSYAADQAIFPIARTAGSSSLLLAFAFVGVPLLAERLPAPAILIPFLILVARRDRPEHPDRLLRPDLARHRRLHGGRRLRRLQLRAARCRSMQPHRWSFLLGGADARRWSACCSACRACASRASTSRSRRWPRSSSSTGCSCASSGSPTTRRRAR